MSTQPPSGPDSGTPPWQQKQLSYGLKLLLTFVVVLLLIVVIVTLFTMIAALSSVIGGRSAPGNPNSSLIALLVSVVLFGGSLFGLIKLYPLVSAPTNFKPTYGAIPADMRGHPFEVRFRRNAWSRSFSGKGTIRFDADTLLVEGYLTPSALFQLGVVLVVTIIPIVVLGIGLGLIPALILAYFLGRKKLASNIAYVDIRDLGLQGCRVSFVNGDEIPRKVDFYVATPDGERLYREMQARFPAATMLASSPT